MTEIFKPIIGFETTHKVSMMGEVVNHRGYKMKNYISCYGYKSLTLKSNNIKKVFFIHRLIAIHFIPNDKNLPFVNHIDGDKLNNNISNLEWCTPLDNVKHARKNGLYLRKHSSNDKLGIIESWLTLGLLNTDELQETIKKYNNKKLLII
jgi:hypothetical protein